MREIGGYFGLESFKNNAYYKDLIELNTGRNALVYLIKAKHIKKIALPYYLCSSIRRILEQHDISYRQYPIDTAFKPLFEDELDRDEYLYVVNYFGQISDEQIMTIKKHHNNIIVDHTQAFFQRPIDGIDTLYSCRKFFGVPDGAYLSTRAQLNDGLQVDCSMHRMRHVLGRFEGDAESFYSDFKENDRSFREEPLKTMSRLTQNILGAIDYEDVIQKRNANYTYLDKALNKKNALKTNTPVAPYGYPFYIKNGKRVRDMLASQRIYIPTLWPDVLSSSPLDPVAYDFAENILLLPCDQRYSVEDMAYMVKCLERVIE